MKIYTIDIIIQGVRWLRLCYDSSRWVSIANCQNTRMSQQHIKDRT